MTINFSSSSNDSLHPNISSNNLISPFMKCYITRPGFFIYFTYRITYILLLLPLCINVIYHAVQQWRQKRSTSSIATMSHCDSITYHMVTMELIGLFGSVLVICGICSNHVKLFLVAYFLLSVNWYGEMFFHVLTCVERYLAVVHPITYLSLRKERGIRIRNISISCVWLLCIIDSCFVLIKDVFIIMDFCLLTLSLTVVSFCSISVLCVLIRPGPGEQGESRKRTDQSKLRAFYTIMAILGVLMFRFAWNLVWSIMSSLGSAECVIMTIAIWSSLPSSLVLPLLFLHTAGKLVCCKNSIK